MAFMAASVPVAAASTLQMQDGVLWVAGARGGSPRLGIGRSSDGPSGVYSAGPFTFEDRYSAAVFKWPGRPPGAGVGCPSPLGDTTCSGVSRVTIALGDGDDTAGV